MRYLSMYLAKKPKNKVWIRVSKKVSKKAVVRNKVKRRIREAIRDLNLNPLLIISAKPNSVDATVKEFRREVNVLRKSRR